MGINISQNRIHCFACGVKVSPFELIKELEGIEKNQQVFNLLNLQKEYEKYVETKVERVEKKQVLLPEGFRAIDDRDGIMGRAAQHYMKRRRYNIKKLASEGVGYCIEGKYMGYIIFPIYYKGQLVFFQGRKFMDFGPKMKNPEMQEFGIGKSQVIYNIDALFIYNTCYIAESITNAKTMGERCCATLGKTFSNWQMSMFLKAPCTGLIFLLDEDAYYDAIIQAMQLVQFKKIKVIKMPKDKDVNDVGKAATLKLIRSTPWQRYTDLLKIKIELDGKNPEYSHYRRRSNYSPTRGAV
jgi:DNA primase